MDDETTTAASLDVGEDASPSEARPRIKLWSHDAAQRSRSADDQEALSRRYGNYVILILPLSSGRFAIFGTNRQLYAYMDSPPTAEELRALSIDLQKSVATNSPIHIAQARIFGIDEPTHRGPRAAREVSQNERPRGELTVEDWDTPQVGALEAEDW